MIGLTIRPPKQPKNKVALAPTRVTMQPSVAHGPAVRVVPVTGVAHV